MKCNAPHRGNIFAWQSLKDRLSICSSKYTWIRPEQQTAAPPEHEERAGRTAGSTPGRAAPADGTCGLTSLPEPATVKTFL